MRGVLRQLVLLDRGEPTGAVRLARLAGTQTQVRGQLRLAADQVGGLHQREEPRRLVPSARGGVPFDVDRDPVEDGGHDRESSLIALRTAQAARWAWELPPVVGKLRQHVTPARADPRPIGT